MKHYIGFLLTLLFFFSFISLSSGFSLFQLRNSTSTLVDCSQSQYQKNCSVCTTNTQCAWCSDSEDDDDDFCFDPSYGTFHCTHWASGAFACSNTLSLAIGAIVGIVFGICFCITACICLCVWICRYGCRPRGTLVYNNPTPTSPTQQQQQPLLIAMPATRSQYQPQTGPAYYPPGVVNSSYQGGYPQQGYAQPPYAQPVYQQQPGYPVQQQQQPGSYPSQQKQQYSSQPEGYPYNQQQGEQPGAPPPYNPSSS